MLVRSIRGRRNNGGRRRPLRVKSVQPPPISQPLRISHKFRFTVVGSPLVNSSVTWSKLMQLYCYGISTTTMAQLFDTVKIDSIDIWGVCPNNFGGASTAAVTVSLQWGAESGGLGSENVTYSDTSISTDRPPYLHCSPKPSTTVGMWHGSDTTAAVYLTAPIGSVIDVTLELTVEENSDTLSTFSVTGGTAGAINFTRLDSNYAVPVVTSANITNV